MRNGAALAVVMLLLMPGWAIISICFAGQTAPPAGPYTIYQEYRGVNARIPDSQQKPIIFATTIWARRSDGSLATVEHALGGATTIEERESGSWVTVEHGLTHRRDDMRRELKFSSGKFVKIFDCIQIKTTIQYAPEELRSRELDPASFCMSTYGGERRILRSQKHIEKIREEDILGYRTYRVTSDDPPASSALWLAPDLDCTVLRRLMGPHSMKYRFPPLSFPAHVLLDTTKVVPGEPPGWILDIPDYREMPPVEAYQEYARWVWRKAGMPDDSYWALEKDLRNLKKEYAAEEKKYLADRAANAGELTKH